MLSHSNRFKSPLQHLRLLEERVRRTGASLPQDASQLKRFHGIKCLINKVSCVVDISTVAEVIKVRYVTPIPGAVAWIEGVMNFRGALVPVYNLQQFLIQAEASVSKFAAAEGPLLVCKVDKQLIALRVSKVSGMQKFDFDEFTPVAQQNSNPQQIEFYIDASIASNGSCYQRFDVTRLIDVLNSYDPCRQPAALA